MVRGQTEFQVNLKLGLTTCPGPHALAVLEDDTLETLSARVFHEECKALPEAIELYAAGRLKLEGRRVSLLSPL